MYQTSKKQAKVIQACLKPSCKVQLKKDGAEAARVDTPGWTNVRGWTSLDTPQVSTSGRLFLVLCHSGFRHGLENWFLRVHLLVATELAYSVFVSVSVFIALSTVFYSINSPGNSPLSHSAVLLVLFLSYWSFQLYLSLRKYPSALI